MKIKPLWLAAGLGMLTASGIAYACADSSCAPSWKLAAGSADCANRALLTPGNDTRVNLLFLMRGKAGLGFTGTRYPDPGYNGTGYGHTFLDWHVLNDALFPRPEGEEDSGTNYSGSRCISLGSGTSAFLAAMQANTALPAGERSKLSAARELVAQACAASEGSPAKAAWPSDIASPAGKAFLSYLQGSEAFYGERWDDARQSFAGLTKASDPWLRETAGYMLGRVELNAAQAKAFDDSGWFSGIKELDKAAADRATAAFSAYLKAWPNGRYADSARGLQRRVLWLKGDTQALAADYARALGSVNANSEGALRLVEEIDNKLLFAGERKPAASGPVLLATLDLMKMRDNSWANSDGTRGGDGPSISAAEIEGQAAAFAGEPELYGYVKASHAFYVAKDYRQVLALIPDDSHRSDYSPVAFSRQVLRGMALSALGDRNEAGFWRDMLAGSKGMWQRPTVELGLALNLERHGQVAQVFAKDSPIQDSMIRKILLVHSAAPAVLRAAAQDGARPRIERDMALFTLLYKQLLRGDYAGFVTNRALVPADASTDASFWYFTEQDSVPLGLFAKGRWSSNDYPCPALVDTARKLAANAGDIGARLCVGEFLRLNNFDGFDTPDHAPPRDELGGFAADFPGKSITRDSIYTAIIANRAAAPNDRAYALYRAVNCYAPSGFNGCGGAEVPQAQRKAWFDQLKREYPASPWARKLRFYW